MRTHLLRTAVLATVACRPPGVVEPARPVAREAPAPAAAPVARPAPVATPGPAPTPELAPEPEPPPTWAWALAVLPELAEHREDDPGEAALAKFLTWFEGGARRVHVLLGDACHAVAGEPGDDGFHGSWQRQVMRHGDERRVSSMDLAITRHGISESGPGGVIYHRDGRGSWQESGMFATGYFRTLVDHPMSAADDQEVTFAGYSYGLAVSCQITDKIAQTCTGGGQRTCERCTGVGLQRHAGHMAWHQGRITIRRAEVVPVDCTQACPADAWTPLLPRLTTVLAGRKFAGVLPEEGPTVFRTAKGCARELRRRHAAAAAERRAERAEASR